jgi:hypothetical protein
MAVRQIGACAVVCLVGAVAADGGAQEPPPLEDDAPYDVDYPPPPPELPLAPAASARAKSPDPCAASAFCRERGKCTTVAPDTCGAVGRDCAASRICRDEGRCVARAGHCRRTEPAPSTSPPPVASSPTAAPIVLAAAGCLEDCRERGRCILEDGECVARSEDGCRASLACRERGDCFYNFDGATCDDGQRRRSRGAIAGGVVMVSVGGAALLGGIAAYALNGRRDSGPPIAVAVAGGAVLTAGIPLLVWGSRKEYRYDSAAVPEVAVGAGSGSLTWRW